MATVRKQVSKSGKVTYRVQWREGGRRDGAWDGETCDGKKIADDFAAMVRLAGERRPAGFPKGCRGRALLPAEPSTHSSSAALDMGDGLVEDSPHAPTLAKLFEEYLGKLRKTEPRQIAQNRRMFELHVRHAVVTLPDGSKVGPLGGLPIDQFTTEVDEAWVEWMESRTYVYRKARKDEAGKTVKADVRNYSPKTIRNVHGSVLFPALGYAARKYGKLVPVNPCADVVLPEAKGRSVTLDHVPTGEEIGQWIEIGYEVSQLAGDVITVAMGTGLRWGELIALRPCDVDLERGLLTVAQVVKQDQNRRNYIATYGKSDPALRTIRIPDNVVAVLRRRCEGIGRKALLFQAVRGGILRSSYWHDHHWVKVLAKTSEHQITTRATAHKFRHAHATGLLAANVSLDTVSKRLGHKSIIVTSALYSHLTPEADQRAADVIDGLMSGKQAKVTASASSGDVSIAA